MSDDRNRNAADTLREIGRNLRQKSPTVIIEVSGGVVTRVSCNNIPHASVTIVDYDNLGPDGDNADPCFLRAIENLIGTIDPTS